MKILFALALTLAVIQMSLADKLHLSAKNPHPDKVFEMLVRVDPGLILSNPAGQGFPQLVRCQGGGVEADGELLSLHRVLLVVVRLLGDVHLPLDVRCHPER